MTLKQDKPTIEIWTDGSIQPTNPGPHGGWGAIIVGQEVNEGHKYRAMSGYYLARNIVTANSAGMHLCKVASQSCTA